LPFVTKVVFALGAAMLRAIALVFAVLALKFLSAFPALAEKRVALVIGNAAYVNETRLANPEKDARDVAAALKTLGFDDVAVHVNADLKTMSSALAQFARKADAADLALVYYSGHGIEVDGRNFLLPIDARLGDAADVDFEAISMELTVSAADRARGVKIIVLDACRINPFRARLVQRQGARRSIGRGLVPVAPATGMLVAFSAKGGTEADDGLPGGNSPFTEAFLRHAAAAGLDVRIMRGRVRDDVVRKTSRQEPFTYGSLGGDTISLNPEREAPTAPQWRRSSTEASDAAQSWVIAKDSTSEAVLEAFMEKYKADPFYHALARDRLAAVRRETAERQRLAMLQKGEEEKRKRAEAETRKRAEDEAKRKAEEEEARKRASALTAAAGASQSIAQAPSKQIRLTERQIESFIGAYKGIDAILNKTPQVALDKLDAKAKAEIEGVAKPTRL
jgi:uncharacterized caspase-like protein